MSVVRLSPVLRRALLFVLCSIAAALPGFARQDLDRGVEHVAFPSERWTVEGDDGAVRFEQYRGRSAVRLQGGALSLDDADFRNGTIEFDMAFPHERGFHGLNFRVENEREYDHFYFRSHLSGMPDANQYQPVTGGSAAWQLMHGESFSSPTVYKQNEWIHVRLVVQGDSAEMYIDSVEPELTFKLRSRAESGGITLYASALNPVWYSGFAYSRSDETLRGRSIPLDAPPAGTVMTWNVSTPVSEATAAGPKLDSSPLSSLEWRRIAAEESGIANLARVIDDGIAEDRDRTVTNTVIARLTVESDSAAFVPLTFGYSDRARVFLNGRLLYEGDNGYQTRDYRYLGTIGLFDTVWLNLDPGQNMIDFAISEDFGGWGLIARFPDADGLTFDAPLPGE